MSNVTDRKNGERNLDYEIFCCTKKHLFVYYILCSEWKYFTVISNTELNSILICIFYVHVVCMG